MHKFVIYTQVPCKWCDKAKDLMKAQGFTYEERPIAEPGNRQWFDENDFKTVPQIYVMKMSGWQHIGTYTDLQIFLEDGA